MKLPQGREQGAGLPRWAGSGWGQGRIALRNEGPTVVAETTSPSPCSGSSGITLVLWTYSSVPGIPLYTDVQQYDALRDDTNGEVSIDT